MRVYIFDEVKLPVDSLPEVVLTPDQLPLALQEVALVELQVRVADALYETEVELAEIEIVGAEGVELRTPPHTCASYNPAQLP
ncbi:MAG: hypothetical protein A3D92_10465 [Bacteroidetes bacterium RIFCSPHIGHO2_02_FULL_44_7]|nr:MAG: hypothetical protein A3D92_10465 [Bacteroidetes bacterium RIFCSPHIGHO2_02_FULL_44_7]